MKIRLLAAAVVALVLPSALAAQDAPKPALDPVGKYQVQAVVQGQTAAFEMIVEKKDDGTYTGTLANPDFGTSIIASLKVEGRTVKIVLATPQGTEATIECTVAEDGTVDGSWAMQGDGGKITGKKLP
ncbi:MAG: hypothetical protein FJ363_07490 [Gemmatimonadetes bacterium]|nr:hypothetical protein [Gemmatimonadota bacterium]